MACLDKDNEDNFDVDIRKSFDGYFECLYSYTPWNSLSGESWVDNV